MVRFRVRVRPALEQDVLRLEVAVEHAARVHVVDRGEELRDDSARVVLDEGALLHDPLEQLAAVRHVLYRHVLARRRVLAGGVHAKDGRVLKRLLDLDLADELLPRPRAQRALVDALGRQPHTVVQTHHLEDLRVAAHAKLPHDLVLDAEHGERLRCTHVDLHGRGESGRSRELLA